MITNIFKVPLPKLYAENYFLEKTLSFSSLTALSFGNLSIFKFYVESTYSHSDLSYEKSYDFSHILLNRNDDII
jgi:hypothetical protein